ncbi:unnamed protein product, partial [Meganyctiphanes norvegica]
MNTDLVGGEFHISHDTQLVQLDIEPGIHVYVHYFTLHDVRARGFVRPMCFAYISSDSRKLLHYFDDLRKQFSQVTNDLKVSNHKWFRSEMEDLISDLEYTKQRYIQLHRHDQLDLNQVYPLEESSENVSNLFTSGPASLAFDAMEITNANFNLNQHMEEGGGTFDHREDDSEFEKQGGKKLNSDCHKKIMKNTIVEGNKMNYNYSNKIYEENKVNTDLNSRTNMKNIYTSHNVSIDENEHSEISESHEESVLRQTTLEAVANQLLDCHQIINTLKAYVEQEDENCFIEPLLREVESQPKSPLYQCLYALGILPRWEITSVSTHDVWKRLLFYEKIPRSVRSLPAILCFFGSTAKIMILKIIYEGQRRTPLTPIFMVLSVELHSQSPYPLQAWVFGTIFGILRQQNPKLSVFAKIYQKDSCTGSCCSLELLPGVKSFAQKIGVECHSRQRKANIQASTDLSQGTAPLGPLQWLRQPERHHHTERHCHRKIHPSLDLGQTLNNFTKEVKKDV